MEEYRLYNGSGQFCCKGCGKQDKQLNTYDWLADIPGNALESEYVEVQFKNTRKGYFRNSNQLPLEKGDIVAVEATPGHDIGVVTLTGRLVPLQIKKTNIRSEADIKRVYRKAKPADLKKAEEAKGREHSTMIRARQIAQNLNLNMKIGDVEYQGDGNKAIFYYIADDRVDFRQLIKVLAEVFQVRIEMKQIGARQEAGRIGGIGPCGREMCCATWMKSFVSVSTNAARFQDIALNPQKLAGQCAKLKCCLNYEVDCYVEAQKRLPSKEIELETMDGTYYYMKADILLNQVTYSSSKEVPANLVTISGRRAFEVIGLNKRGIKPDSLLSAAHKQDENKNTDLAEQENIARFDHSGKKKKKKNKQQNAAAGGQKQQNAGGQQKDAAGGQKQNAGGGQKQPKQQNAAGGGKPQNAGGGQQKDAAGGQKQNAGGGQKQQANAGGQQKQPKQQNAAGDQQRRQREAGAGKPQQQQPKQNVAGGGQKQQENAAGGGQQQYAQQQQPKETAAWQPQQQQQQD